MVVGAAGSEGNSARRRPACLESGSGRCPTGRTVNQLLAGARTHTRTLTCQSAVAQCYHACRALCRPPSPSTLPLQRHRHTHTHTHISTPTRADFNLFRFVLSMQMPPVSGFDEFPTACSVIRLSAITARSVKP